MNGRDGWSRPHSARELRESGVSDQLHRRLERAGLLRVAGWQPKSYQVAAPTLDAEHLRELVLAVGAHERLGPAFRVVVGEPFGAQLRAGDTVSIGGRRHTVVGVDGHAIVVAPEDA